MKYLTRLDLENKSFMSEEVKKMLYPIQNDKELEDHWENFVQSRSK